MNINWGKYGIDISKAHGGKMICPKCAGTRKNKRDKSLSVDVQTGAFNCHYSGCDFRGYAVEIHKEKKVYQKPLPRLEKLSAKSIQFFESRGISNNTVLRFGVTEAKEWMPQFEKEVSCICFNYQRGGELVNIKFRGPQKSFKMAKDAELIFYNYDAGKEEEEILLVEGEIDCLTLYECGFFNCLSVPNGASLGSLKLEYLDNCWQLFEKAKRIVLAVDNDPAGNALREELARRIGKDKCYTIDYPEGSKDLNDVLLKNGKDAVKSIIEAKKIWPIAEELRMDKMYETICEWYENGYPKGSAAGIEGLDDLLTFAPKQLTIVTGIPSHGKDEFTNLIITKLAQNSGWVFGDCGFEEDAPQTVTKLIEKHSGKSFDFRQESTNRISQQDFEHGIYFVDKHFHFYNTEAIDSDLDTLLSVGESFVKRYGINGLRLNPWNWIEDTRPAGMTETEGVSISLTKIIRFAKKWGVHVFLIAHTTKMQKEKNGSGKYVVPNLYDISGSAHFYNKAHNGICVYRDDCVDVYVQKVKQSWFGEKGYATYSYDTMRRKYHFLSSSVITRPLPRIVPMNYTEPKTGTDDELF